MKSWTTDDIHKALDEVFSQGYCLHPNQLDCSGGIVDAHTIQLNGQLDRIANEAGKVYALERKYAPIEKGELPFRLLSTQSASTYRCFCSKHDQNTFAPIETGPPTFCPQGRFLFHYRVVCRALYLEQQRCKAAEIYSAAAQGRISRIELQDWLERYTMGNEARLHRIRADKAQCDQLLGTQAFGKIEFAKIEFVGAPVLLTSDLIFPQQDFCGRTLQSLSSESIMQSIALSIVALADERIAALFTWQKPNRAVAVDLIRSLQELPEARIGDAIVRLVFTLGGNMCISPRWWENPARRNELGNRLVRSVGSGSYELIDDDLQYVNWRLASWEQPVSL